MSLDIDEFMRDVSRVPLAQANTNTKHVSVVGEAVADLSNLTACCSIAIERCVLVNIVWPPNATDIWLDAESAATLMAAPLFADCTYTTTGVNLHVETPKYNNGQGVCVC